MPKFGGAVKSPPKVTAAPKSPVKSRVASPAQPDTFTYEGGEGWSRKAKSELFLLAVTNMVGEKTFYENASKRDGRFEDLIRKVAQKDPDWVARFVPYLRDVLNMRSASVVMAAELVHSMLEHKRVHGAGWTTTDDEVAASFAKVNNRKVIASALLRADEPAEMLGYWITHFGKNLPQPVKRGVANAVQRLYSEFAFLKYGSADGIRMADVIELVHPDARGPWQAALFEYILQDRHNRDSVVKPDTRVGEADGGGAGFKTSRTLVDLNEQLPTIAARKRLEAVPQGERAASQLVGVPGVTWEWASSWYGKKLDAAFWEAMIPSMGYMALLRNLRNFDEAHVSDEVAETVAAKLRNPDEVAKSRQLPMRFLSAFTATKNLRWAHALEKALEHSLVNVPWFSGKTLILVDNSTSMDDSVSGQSDMTRRQVAGLFGAVVALRASDPTLVAYADSGQRISVPEGGSVLPLAKKAGNVLSGGTQTMQVLAQWYAGHDRVVILTDEQAFGSGYGYTGFYGGTTVRTLNPSPEVTAIKVPIYTFNLAGYKAGHLQSGTDRRYTFGGLSDACFKLIDLLDRGENAAWPF